MGLNNPVCNGQNVTIYAIGSGGDSLHYHYQWVDDGLTGDAINEKGFKNGWRKVILTDNCSRTPAMDSVYVTVIPLAKAVFTWGQVQKINVNQKISFLN